MPIPFIDFAFSYPNTVLWRDTVPPKKEELIACIRGSHNLKEASIVPEIDRIVHNFFLQNSFSAPEGFTAQLILSEKGQLTAKSTNQFFQGFINQNSLTIGRKGSGSLCIDLSVHLHMITKRAGGGTTASLRFPHLYQSIVSTIPVEMRSRNRMHVCLLGPGLYEGTDILPECPMLVELMSLFPLADLVVLEKQEKICSVLKENIQQDCLMYDPKALISRTLINVENPLLAPESYLRTFGEMLLWMDKWGKVNQAPCVLSMLTGLFRPEKIAVRPSDSQKIEVRQFDINTSKIDEIALFDLIVGTKVFLHAQLECKTDFVERLAKILASLKEGGMLYLDRVSWDLIKENASCKTDRDLFQRLAAVGGDSFAAVAVPMPPFATIENRTMISLRVEREDIPTISTDALVLVKKPPKKE